MSASKMYDTLSEGKHNNNILTIGLVILTEKVMVRIPLREAIKKKHETILKSGS